MSPRKQHATAPGGPDDAGTSIAKTSEGMTFWRAMVIVALVLVAYAPLWQAGFIWDDNSMLTANPLIRAPDGLYQFWFTRNAIDYWPVTSTSLWVEWRLWGLNPLGYHLTNLALHLAGVMLFWSVLRRLRVPGAWLAALLFAVHPINVESVTWIAERKNLLALVFYLLSIRWFLKSGIVEGATRQRFAPPWHWLSLLAFVLAMLSKGSVATLPLVLAGIIAWHRRPTLADLARLVPFFIVAGVLAAVDVWFQRHGLPEVIRQAGFLERLLGAGGVVWFYLFKSLWPARLIFVYPPWHIAAANPAWWLPILGALGVTALFWRLARRETLPGERWGRATLFGWGYFCVSLVPVLGFTDVYFMKFSLVADHYAHVALIGVVAWAGFAADSLYRRANAAARFVLAGLVVVAIAALAGLTWRQNRMYRDNFVLYRTTLALNPDCWMAHNNLGQLLAAQPNHGPEARIEFEAALRLKPDYPDAHNNLGLELSAIPGRAPDAVAQFNEALRSKPNYASAHNNLANELAKNPARLPEAISHYEEALRIDPDFAEAHNNLGAALMKTPGRLPDAVAHLEQALRINPDYANAHYNLGLALMQIPGREPEAASHFEQALRINPALVGAHLNLADFLARTPGRLPEAVSHYEQALRINPDDADTQNNLAVALAKMPGRLPDALLHFEAALRISPNDADLHYNLANQLAKIPGRLPDAAAHYDQALRIRPDFTSAHYNIAVALARMGRIDEAERHFERVIELDPANAPARQYLDQLRAASR
jgi:tetratricopeptide (TPR) repeat protein